MLGVIPKSKLMLSCGRARASLLVSLLFSPLLLPPLLLWGCAQQSDAPGGRNKADSGVSADASDPYDGLPVVACGARGETALQQEVTDESGVRLRVLAVDPEPPRVGDNTWLIELTLQGEPLSGVAEELLIAPRMPDHGHGSSVQVGVSEEDAGQYRLAPLNLFMPGYWEIEVSVPEVNPGDGGTVAVPSARLTVRICVE